MFAPCMPFAITLFTEESGSVHLPINSEFFKGLIADVFNFFETGETSFCGEQTLEIMRLRESIIKAKNEPEKWFKI